MDDNGIPYRIERTRNKHSRAVYRGDQIVIRLAKNLSSKEEQHHIDNLVKRMTKKVVALKEKVSINPFKEILEGENSAVITLSDHTKYLVNLVPSSRNKITIKDRNILVEIRPEIRRKNLHRILWKALSEAEYDRVKTLVQNINYTTINGHIDSFVFRYTTSQWGSCSSKGKVALNTSLLFVPAPLLEYVIVHELAHLKQQNHSPKFWAIVEQYLPNYRELRRQLHHYRLPKIT